MKRLLLPILLLLLFITPDVAQTTYQGTVKNAEGKPMPDITVVATSRTDTLRTLAYTFTNSQGEYRLTVNAKDDNLRLCANGFNVQRTSRIVPNRSATCNFTVKEEIINLREVSVRADKIWQIGDTLNYSVASFASGKDISIGDVLKKLPGISVASSGAISYKGKPISHFYVEGMDLMQGRYGIATNNLSQKAVSVVQVLENHQPIKALKKLDIPDEAAINLKLTDSAKGVFSIEALLGLGSDADLLWRTHLIGTYFGKKRQHFITYKSGNDGTDIGAELQSLTQPSGSKAAQYTSMLMPSPPAIAKSQYYFNNSQAVSFNTVWKTRHKDDVNFGMVYFNDHEKRNSLTQTTYMLADGNRTLLTENIHSALNTDKTEANFAFNRNTEKRFFEEKMSFSAAWYGGKGTIDTGSRISQTLSMESLHLSNKMHAIFKNSDYRGWELTNTTKYDVKPQHLTVNPCLFDTLFGSTVKADGMRQKVVSRTFTSNTEATLLTDIMFHSSRLSPRAIFEIQYDNIDSRLSPLPALSGEVDSSMRNDTYLYKVKTGASADMSYSLGIARLDVMLPLTYAHNRLRQRLQNLTLNQEDVHIDVFAHLALDMGLHWDAVARYSLTHDYPGIETQYSGTILSDYRTLQQYRAYMSRSVWQYAGAELNYKNPLLMFFAGLSASYSCNKPKVLYGYNMDGIRMLITTLPTQERMHRQAVSMKMSKGLYWKKLTLALEAAWDKSRTPVLRQDKVNTYLNESGTMKGSIKMAPCSFLDLSYEGIWYLGKGRTKDGEAFPAVRTFTHNMEAALSLPWNITLTSSWHNYYNNRAFGNKSFTLSDLKLTYRLHGMSFDLTCNNLLGVKNYIYSNIGDMTTYYTEYRIRPRAVVLSVRFKIL